MVKIGRASPLARGGERIQAWWTLAGQPHRRTRVEPSPPKGGSVGIDLGVKELATLSDRRLLASQRNLPHGIPPTQGENEGRARNPANISIEDLNRGIRSVEDAAFAEFRRQLEYKTARTGARLHVIDRWYPSSMTCRTAPTKLSLSGQHRRDLNAAINIQVAGSAPD